MSIIIEKIKIKNFMSCGNKTQEIDLHDKKLTLILGENMEFGGGASRNGVGKSTILQAVHFGLFGDSIENKIRKDNLCNKINSKNCQVEIEYSKNGKHRKIIRGRKPNVMKFYMEGHEINDSDNNKKSEENLAEGSNKNTDEEILKDLGISPKLFCHAFMLNNTTQPFLINGLGNQRSLIEELLCVKELSDKAVILKEKISGVKKNGKTIEKGTKDIIIDEEKRITGLEEANKVIQDQINSAEKRVSAWSQTQVASIRKYENELEQLLHVDIEKELKAHADLKMLSQLREFERSTSKDLSHVNLQIKNNSNAIEKLAVQLQAYSEKKCPECGQEIKDDTHEHSLKEKSDELQKLMDESASLREEQGKFEKSLVEIQKGISVLENTETTYKKESDAYNHKSKINSLENKINDLKQEKNPHEQTLKELKTNGLKEISYEKLNETKRILKHQELLLKLLTERNSSIRKKVIEQNLEWLNTRLEEYLENLGLSHQVVFNSDLTVDIQKLGQEFDYDNLSKGEKIRLNLALAFSFRDVWETMNGPINLLMVDEVLDDGLDKIGVETALEQLNYFVEQRQKDVFLISHREDLQNRCSNVLLVRKEGGFTEFDPDPEET